MSEEVDIIPRFFWLTSLIEPFGVKSTYLLFYLFVYLFEFGAMPGGSQSKILALHPGITSGVAKGIIESAKIEPTLTCKASFLIHYILSPAPKPTSF